MASYKLLRISSSTPAKLEAQRTSINFSLQPDIADIILQTESVVEADMRPKRDFELYVSETNLHRMLVSTCEAQDPHEVESLLQFGLQHNVPADSLLGRAVVHAVMQSDINVALFEKFVAIMPDVINLNMSHAGDPLSYAIGGHMREAQSLPHQGTVGLVRFLLEHGTDPNKIQFPEFETSGYYLFIACQRANVEVVRLLLKHGAQIEGSGAAQVAAARGHIDVLDVLLQHSADLNACFKITGTRGKEYEGSATEVAIRCGLNDVVLWLAEHGVQ